MARKLNNQEISEIIRELAPGGIWALKEIFKAGTIKPEEIDGRNLRSPRRLGLIEARRSAVWLTEIGEQVARRL